MRVNCSLITSYQIIRKVSLRPNPATHIDISANRHKTIINHFCRHHLRISPRALFLRIKIPGFTRVLPPVLVSTESICKLLQPVHISPLPLISQRKASFLSMKTHYFHQWKPTTDIMLIRNAFVLKGENDDWRPFSHYLYCMTFLIMLS